MDNQKYDLDIWEDVVEKTVNAKAKASLQSLSGTEEINSRYPKSYKPSAKKDKNKITREHRDKNEDKAKSYNLSLTHTTQSLIHASKKNKPHGNRQGGYPATKVNTIKVIKKNKDKAKNLRYIKCYTYK